MSRMERVDAVLAGQQPDRPPVSFWYHFLPQQAAGAAALAAHLDVLERFDLDFLKVMNDNPYPHAGRIERIEELASLGPLHGDEGGFGAQLELLAALRGAVKGRVYMATTIFNAWSTLRQLVQPPRLHKPPNLDPNADAGSAWLRDAHTLHSDLVSAALRMIGENLARFAAKCLQAGADGIFLSVRDDWVDTPKNSARLYDTLVRPSDLAILGAVRHARFNILHVCGTAVRFHAFTSYPVAVLHWADRAAGPPIREVKDAVKPALCGGVDNLGTLVTGTPDQVAGQVRDALAQAAPRPLMIAPGCTFDPQRVPEANLRAMIDAAKSSPP